jgi:uncharacterized protein YggE
MKIRMALLLGILSVSTPAGAQAISGAPYIAVHGSARAEVVPDVFPLALTLSETSKDMSGTQEKIEAMAAQVLAIADRMKVAESDLTIANLEISPEYDYDNQKEEQVFLGNSYEREIKIRFHSLDRMREFITALPADKVLKVDTGKFETSRAEAVRRDLLKKAIENARETARALAAGVGRKLGAVHTVSNRGFNVSYSDSATPLGSVAVAGSTALLAPGVVSMREGRITLDQDVYIVYALE